MISPPPGLPRLAVGEALRDGWTAFCRAPWVFTGFVLLGFLLYVTLEGIAFVVVEGSVEASIGSALVLLLCRVGQTAVALWSAVGLVRGAWIALAGRRPAFGELLRWDGGAVLRVLLANVLLSVTVVLLALPFAVAILIALARMVQIDFPFAGVPVLRSFDPSPGALLLLSVSSLVLLVGLTYVQVSQHFLVPLAVLRGSGPLRTLREGPALVHRQWWPTLGLISLEVLLLLAGLIVVVIGMFVAAPLIVCVSTAAYRQLSPEAGS